MCPVRDLVGRLSLDTLNGIACSFPLLPNVGSPFPYAVCFSFMGQCQCFSTLCDAEFDYFSLVVKYLINYKSTFSSPLLTVYTQYIVEPFLSCKTILMDTKPRKVIKAVIMTAFPT